MGLKEKKRMGRMVLFPFILLQRKKGKKRFEKEEEDGEDEEWILGNEVMGLPMGVRVFIKWVMNVVVFIPLVMNIMK